MAGIGNLYGLFLSNIFVKSRKHLTRKHKASTKRVKKHKKNTNNKRMRKRRTRKYKMKGGWGESPLPPLPSSLSNITRVMKGGWGGCNEIIM